MNIRRTTIFANWLAQLRDRSAKARIFRRLERLKDGNLGDARPVGEGVSELRVDHGPGYRIYFVKTDNTVIVLLCGGDKDSQTRDINRAKQLAKEWKDG